MHASQDRFFLAIEAGDPKFDHHATRSFLQSLGAKEVSDVEE
jgi:ActD protein